MFSNDERTVGLIVDQIIDIVEEAVTMRRPNSPVAGILGSAVVGKFVADFLDLQAILEAAGENFFGRSDVRSMATVLLAEASTFNRGLMRNQLEMSGYSVVEAASFEDAVQRAEKQPVQVLVVDSELCARDPAALEKMRKSASASNLKILAISNTPREIADIQAAGLNFVEHQLRCEREAMLQSISRLSQAVSRAGKRSGPGDCRAESELY